MLHVTLASAICTRDGLQSSLSTLTAKLNGVASEATNPAPGLKITQNNQLLLDIGSSALANTTSPYSPFQITAIDTEICTIARFLLVNQGTPSVPALLSIRLKTSESSALQELEILNVLKGSHAFFSPQNFPKQAPAIWSSPTAGNLSRTELLRIANLYPSGIQAGDGSAIPQGASCPRIENGVQTTTTCSKGLGAFKQIVRERRWVVDTLTGVVLGEFYFDKPASRGLKYGLWLNEYFKIDNGKMVGIQAAMKELGGVPFQDIWADGAGKGRL